jgi:hypothetical protein
MDNTKRRSHSSHELTRGIAFICASVGRVSIPQVLILKYMRYIPASAEACKQEL